MDQRLRRIERRVDADYEPLEEEVDEEEDGEKEDDEGEEGEEDDGDNGMEP